jgi:diacylglycerol kinase (ATP)
MNIGTATQGMSAPDSATPGTTAPHSATPGTTAPDRATPETTTPRTGLWLPSRPRIRVIWNPESGAKGGIRVRHVDEGRLRDAMQRAGLGTELIAAADAAETRALARDAARRGYDVVVAAGGDGTVDLIAGELLGSETALGILPLGTVMNIARSLGLPRDLDAAADVIANGVVRSVDVGEVRGRPFFEGASVGMNAAMFGAAEAFDRGDWRAIARTIWTAIRYRPARMSIDLDDRKLRTRALMVAVANGPYVGAGLTIAPAARLDDGHFDVRVFRRLSKLRLVRHLVSIAFGRHRYAPEVDSYRSRSVRIEGARALPARADSRDIGTTPVEFAMRPAALKVVAPMTGFGAGPSDVSSSAASTIR